MSFGTPEQQSLYDALCSEIEDAVSDPARLRVLEDSVRGGNLDADDRNELLGRIGTYTADSVKDSGFPLDAA